jgi:hypothetical protein
MRNIYFAIGIILISAFQLQGQDLRTTYPVDSCLYFMSPFDYRVQNSQSLGNDYNRYISLFRSTDNPDVIITGKAGWVTDTFLYVLQPMDQGKILLTVPELPEGFEDNWPGGPPPFPILLHGFLQTVNGQQIDPPLPITMRVFQIFFEDSTD